MTMTLDNYLSNFVQTTDFPSLDAMHYIMDKLGNPQKELKFIHVAGTNGKGSICEMLSQTLTYARYKTGKFISPHLLVSNESICVDNIMITDEEALKYIPILSDIANSFEREYSRKVTRFEILTSLAILYYTDKKCDICVLETGLGGTYDCTNIVDSIISVFGSISFDHTSILGNSLSEIANQKAGIIKSNTDTVIFNQGIDVIQVMKKTCIDRNSVFHLLTQDDISNCSINGTNQIFDFKNYKNIEINLIGIKQIENTSVVLECFDILKNKYNFNLSDDVIRTSLKSIHHPARFEQICKEPNIIFDGAHNENAMKNLVNSINTYYSNSKKKCFIFSILTTKKYKEVLKELKPVVNIHDCSFIFTSGVPNETQYVSKEELYKTALELGFNENQIKTMDFYDAVSYSLDNLYDYDIFIIGSFYVYNSVLKILKDKNNSPK